MNRSSLSLLLPFGLLALGCRSAQPNLFEKTLSYRERVSFLLEEHPSGRSIGIENHGPGPVEVEVSLRPRGADGGDPPGAPGEFVATSTVKEGELVSYMLLNIDQITVLHPTQGPARLSWSVVRPLQDGIVVEVQ